MSRPSWARRSRRTASSSSTPCRRRAPRRSCGAPSRRRRSAPTSATSRRSRTPSHSTRLEQQLPEGVAFVTGGGRGIGANIARSLAADGWEVVVGARSRDQVDAVAAEIGGRALELDVASRESVDRAFDEAGPVDLLVANAGVGAADFWRTFEVNVLGVYLC